MNRLALREFEDETFASAIASERESAAPVFDTETETLPLDPHYADADEGARARREWSPGLSTTRKERRDRHRLGRARGVSERRKTVPMLRLATRFGQLRLLAGMCRHLLPL